MSSENIEITELKRTKWRTTISVKIERFSLLLDNKSVSERYFGEKYTEALTSKISRSAKVLVLLALAYSILMFSLLAAQDKTKSEFEIFGYGFKNLGYHKEILLVIAASISPISATLSGYRQYLIALRAECIKRIAPSPEVREFYSHALTDDYIEALLKRHDYRNSSPHIATKALLILLLSVLIVVFLTLLAGSFLLQLSVIIDVIKNPSTSHWVNVAVISYTLASIFLGWTISFLQLPLPEVDLTNYRILTELEKADPAKYQETMRAIAKETSKREDTWSLSLGFVASILTVAFLSFFQAKQSTTSIDHQFAHALASISAALLIAKPAANKVRDMGMRWVFRKCPDSGPNQIQAYTTAKKIILTLRIAIPSLTAAAVLTSPKLFW
jgi:hypothetical protein